MALRAADIAELLRTLQAPVTDFDCGTLCAPGNGGVPVCCNAAQVLPVLYKAELALLQKRSDLWRRHVPRGQDAPLRAAARPCDVFAVCKGHTQCERHNRSLACRTFPFEPYLDHDARFVGIVFAFDQAHLCPLITSDHDISPQFIAECCAMWSRMLELDADERAFYAGCSRTLRRQFGALRRPIPVFTPTGVVACPTRRAGRRGR
ncbi:MAG: hypothetical protein JNK15_11980 [Planctomycetes bacterium]|nr:hypothetical protein [Planctomycetota bacterium]